MQEKIRLNRLYHSKNQLDGLDYYVFTTKIKGSCVYFCYLWGDIYTHKCDDCVFIYAFKEIPELKHKLLEIQYSKQIEEVKKSKLNL